MKNLIKTVLLIFLSTSIFAQDTKRQYTPDEQEQITKDFQELEESTRKASESAKASDISAEAAKKALDNYDKDVKIKADLESLGKKTISRENEGVKYAPAVSEPKKEQSTLENSKDFGKAIYEKNPVLVFVIGFFILSILVSIFKYFTNRD